MEYKAGIPGQAAKPGKKLSGRLAQGQEKPHFFMRTWNLTWESESPSEVHVTAALRVL